MVHHRMNKLKKLNSSIFWGDTIIKSAGGSTVMQTHAAQQTVWVSGLVFPFTVCLSSFFDAQFEI